MWQRACVVVYVRFVGVYMHAFSGCGPLGNRDHERWKVTKYTLSSTIHKYNFEILVLENSFLCCFLLLLYNTFPIEILYFWHHCSYLLLYRLRMLFQHKIHNLILLFSVKNLMCYLNMTVHFNWPERMIIPQNCGAQFLQCYCIIIIELSVPSYFVSLC